MSASTPRRRRWTSGPPSRSACRRRRRSSRRRGWRFISRGDSDVGARRAVPLHEGIHMAHKNKWTAPLRERDITRQIAREHFQEFDRLIESDVIVVGAGPSGLLCGRDLAAAGFKTLLIEQALHLGGGFWSGRFLLDKALLGALLHKRGRYRGVPGSGTMWVARSEELVVENTREVYPTCFLAGLSVSAVDGAPRMGPAFGAMLLSGRRAAALVKKKLKQE